MHFSHMNVWTNQVRLRQTKRRDRYNTQSQKRRNPKLFSTRCAVLAVCSLNFHLCPQVCHHDVHLLLRSVCYERHIHGVRLPHIRRSQQWPDPEQLLNTRRTGNVISVKHTRIPCLATSPHPPTSPLYAAASPCMKTQGSMIWRCSLSDTRTNSSLAALCPHPCVCAHACMRAPVPVSGPVSEGRLGAKFEEGKERAVREGVGAGGDRDTVKASHTRRCQCAFSPRLHCDFG